MLEAKDPYIFRPLPFLIGTADFMQDDYVGLGDLLIAQEPEPYVVGQIVNMPDDSVKVLEDFDERFL